MGELFIRLLNGALFYFYNRPERKLIKQDPSHYIAPEGRRSINPFTLVFQDKTKPRISIFDHTKGDQDVRPEFNGEDKLDNKEG